MATETEHAAGEAAAAAEVALGTPPEAAGPGMPQLAFETFSNQIFWLVVALVIIYFVMSRIALPRIAGVLAERQGTITNDLAAAEELKQKAVDAEEAYKKALADARAEAGKIVAAAKADIQADLDAAQAKADAEIAAKTGESEKAIAEIRAGAVESATTVAKDAAAEILASMGFSADAKAVDAAVADQIKG
ncbi:F0F1 ATP synthase subunit B' [Maritimibacter sp. DP1N21-5]|uniref:F0F1 ATP synthase subunit B' n=1 Tax=Maritimibacter sp. DP1N21-5 TaxID=2836867 RepID=UPI001C453C7B|nr:F0F1 ATP synthase subunit B' [Maritimibacter sp. DP1N21-5]MBV7407674.1 F0F1 ATP synthase subunit B' [Maritimibacter sp. DP1N21-5]